MRHFNNIIFAAALVFVASCAKEQEQQIVTPSQEGFENVVFDASGEAVRTVLGTDGKSVSWVKNDQVKFVWGEESGDAAVAMASSSGASASFTVSVPSTEDKMYAVSPASCFSAYDGVDTLTVRIPSNVSGTFAEANIAVSRIIKEASWPSAITFKNFSSVLEFEVTNEKITSLSVSAVGGEPLVGNYRVFLEEGNLTSDIPDVAGTSSTAEIAISEAGNYYLAVIPGVTYAKGIRVDFTLSEGEIPSYYYNPSTPLESAAGKIISFGSLDTRVGAYYVTVDGAGNKMGKSWANAMDIAAFKALVGKKSNNDEAAAQAAQLNGSKIYFSAETFDMGECVTLGFPGQSADIPVEFVGKIEGNDTTTFTGGGTHRLLTVDGDYAKLSVSNVVFCNSSSSSGGQAAIRLAKTSAGITLTDCVIRDNVNTTSGGAVFTGNGTLVLERCTIKSNESTSGAGLNIGGNATVSINNCSFLNNVSSERGGAIYLSKGKVEINGGTFKENTAVKQGGAVYVTSADSKITIMNAEFNANGKCTNTDEGHGGAVYSAGGATTEISGCTFTSNTSRVGGAIGSSDSSGSNVIKVNGCTFSENTSSGVGGAIIMNSKGKVDITNSTFTSNKSGGNGGAIRANDANLTLTLDNLIFKDNYASGLGVGGGLYIENGAYRINKCCFNGNHGTTSGAFYTAGTNTVYLNNCLFTGNYISSTNGTTIRAWSTGTKLCMNNCTFADNTYTSNSSANGNNCTWIYFKGNATVISNCTLIGYSRKGTNGSTNSGGAALTTYDNSGGTGTVHLINNIIAHRNTSVAKSGLRKANGNLTLNLVSNKTSGYTSVTPASTSGTDAKDFWGTTAYFGGLQYVSDENPTWNNCYWNWNGTLTKGTNLEMDTADNIISAINTADSAFKAWLDTVEGLTKDGQGNLRGEGKWWPGSHQGSAQN